MAHADKLRTISQRFHGYEDPETGEKVAGVKLRYEEALDEALDALVAPFEAEGKRPPAEDVRAARARQRVKRTEPDLYDEYHALEATMRRIERWLRDSRSAIMARQSVLKTERELAGKPMVGAR
jgi:glutathione S-transferase